jgi:hypothetical protein
MQVGPKKWKKKKKKKKEEKKRKKKRKKKCDFCKCYSFRAYLLHFFIFPKLFQRMHYFCTACKL